MTTTRREDEVSEKPRPDPAPVDEIAIRRLVAEALDSDRTPEDVCAQSPQMLGEVRLRLERLRRVGEELDALFPAHVPAMTSEGGALPRIPGYEIESVLGRGGMGIVYKARQLELDRTVALKMLLSGAFASEHERARFRREAQAVASLRHAHIVQVFDIGELEGRPYFTMEYQDGGSLAQKLAGAPQTARHAAATVAMLAEAVHAAHVGGIVHRDLKPANILLASDGTPRITDFGLARRIDGPAVTRSGARIGTPSYMAPEQALGHVGSIGPAADVYALGAILYEMLTGRPPFRAESATETERQVIAVEPVSPSRLNPRVPRDLETICLRCLQKEPARRYGSAVGLADDLGRFQRGEPIRARPVGWIERTYKWCRRHPARTTIVAGSTLGAVALLGAVLWTGSQRAATERAVEDDLREVARHAQASDWDNVRLSIERAKARLGRGGSAELRARIERESRDLALVERLDAIRMDRAALVESRRDLRFDRKRADGEYAAAFASAGLGTMDEDAATVAARVAASHVRVPLVAALDDWAAFAVEHEDLARRQWLLEVARRADPDPTGWKDRVRDPSTWADPSATAALSAQAVPSDPSVHLLIALGERLVALRGDAVAFLKRVQREHPDDYWANFALSNAMVHTSPEEAIGFLRAALAIRPKALATHYNLGRALRMVGRNRESIESYERILSLDQRAARAHANIGDVLEDTGNLDGAIEAYGCALALDPQLVPARLGLGSALLAQGSAQAAIAQFELAIGIDPSFAGSYARLAHALQTTGRVDEAIAIHEQAIALDPMDALIHSNLAYAYQMKGRWDDSLESAELAVRLDPALSMARLNHGLALHETGRFDEAIEQFQHAIRLDPRDPRGPGNLGRSLNARGRRDEAIQAYRRALELDPAFAHAHSNLGAALAMMGAVDEAIEHFRRAVESEPEFVMARANLGSALLERGRFVEARAELQRWFDLSAEDERMHAAARSQLERCDGFLALEQRLPAVLEGREEPGDATEHADFAELCRLKQHYATSTRLWTRAFELDPTLTADPRTGTRYKAACCAALAGSARGVGGDGLSDAERASCRGSALDWLRADLAVHDRLLRAESAPPRDFARRILTAWSTDPDLVGLRDEAALAAMPREEGERCRELWREIDRLLAAGGR